MLGCFNQILGQIWTNPNIGLKKLFKNVTQQLGLPIFDPKLGVYVCVCMYSKENDCN